MRDVLVGCGSNAIVTLILASLMAAAIDGSQELPAGAEAMSLAGEALFPPALSPDVSLRLEANLAEARAVFERDPTDPEASIWLGRRTAYLGRYQDAIQIYTRGITHHPNDARLYRHRGHRYLSTRKFELAIADLEKAAELIDGVPDEVEPDGQPNDRNIPTSTSHTNIWYHLGLPYYLTNDLERAHLAYRECLRFSKNPDMLVATSHWLYMTLRRFDRDAEAAALLESIHEGMDVIENGSYYRLLLMYKGLIPPEAILERAAGGGIEQPTSGYGVANWHRYHGRASNGIALLREITASDQWAAFGFIAAEADLQRLETTGR